MKVSGGLIEDTEKASSNFQMEIITMATGKKICELDMECMYITLDINTKDNGLKISKKEEESFRGRSEISMKENGRIISG
jgi:hypothetical protein